MSDNWSQYEKVILHRLDSQDAALQRIETKLVSHGEEIAGLKKTAGITGFIGGILPALAAILLKHRS